MQNDLTQAIERARARLGKDRWLVSSPREHSAAIYHELCRADSGCQRTGAASDDLLPPCQASATFVSRRACRAAG
jgi:hypothetical protein